MAYGFSIAIRQAALNAALVPNCNGATLKMYTGVRPAAVEAAITGTLTSTLTYAAVDSFGAATAATPVVCTAAPITQDSNAVGNAAPVTHFRVWKSDGTTPVFDGNIGLVGSGADLTLNSTTIVPGGIVQISAQTVTL
jgi:hypothetical protein